MLSEKELDAAAQQLADYRKNDALSDILTKFEHLLGEFKRLRSDYEEVREARERWKQQARGQECKPFVLVLVDADGYIFKDKCKCLFSLPVTNIYPIPYTPPHWRRAIDTLLRIVLA